MSTPSNVGKLHGCWCGGNGTKIDRRPEFATSRWEVDVQHDTGTGVVHTNIVIFGQGVSKPTEGASNGRDS